MHSNESVRLDNTQLQIPFGGKALTLFRDKRLHRLPFILYGTISQFNVAGVKATRHAVYARLTQLADWTDRQFVRALKQLERLELVRHVDGEMIAVQDEGPSEIPPDQQIAYLPGYEFHSPQNPQLEDILPFGEAIVFSWLLTIVPDEQGWRHVPIHRLQPRTQMTGEEQLSVLQELQRKGYVTIEWLGKPQRRYVKTHQEHISDTSEKFHAKEGKS